MGNFSSKIFPELESNGKSRVPTHMKMSAIEKNHISTPVMSKKVSSDPRSATVGITRSPIEITSTPPGAKKKVASAIPKYLRGKQYLETNLDLIMPAITPEKRIPDPRSPNVNQERTPIMVKTISGYISPVVMVHEGPDMLTPNGFDPRSPATAFERTPISLSKPSNPIPQTPEDPTSRMSYCETTGDFNLPEIQTIQKISTITLTASKNLEECMRVCDLETPVDNSQESLEDEILDNTGESDSDDQITVIPNLKGLPEFEEQEGEEENDDADNDEEEMREKFSGEECQSTLNPPKPKNTGEKGLIRVWRDSVSPLPPADPPAVFNEASTRLEEIMIEFDDETVVKSLLNEAPKPNVRVDDKSTTQIVNRQIKKVQLGKKEVKGVFEDVSIDTGKSRTPLACRSNHKSGIPSKSPQQILRTKGLSTKPGQQENTPPNTKRFRSKIKGNGSQWDPEMSVII